MKKKYPLLILSLFIIFLSSDAYAESSDDSVREATFKFEGYTRLKYEKTRYQQASEAAEKAFSWRTQLSATGRLSESLGYFAQIQSDRDLQTHESSTILANAALTADIADGKLTLGRFDLIPVNGMLFDGTINGAMFTFGNELSGNLVYGKIYGTGHHQTKDDYDGSDWLCTEDNVLALELNYAPSKKLGLKSAYYRITNNNGNGYYFDPGQTRLQAWEMAFDYKLAANLMLKGNLGRTNAKQANNAWSCELRYKEADPKIAHSFSSYLQYRNLQAHSTLLTTYDNAFAGTSFDPYGRESGGKGFELGFNYVPAPNTLLTVYYSNITPSTEPDRVSESLRAKYYAAMLEFWF